MIEGRVLLHLHLPGSASYNSLLGILSDNWQQSACEIRQAVIDDVRRHIGTQKVYDDITLLVIKPKPSLLRDRSGIAPIKQDG